MKDAFDREIKIGDVVVYVVRSGSNTEINVACITEIGLKGAGDREYVRATCIAGTGYEFKFGKIDMNDGRYERKPYSGRTVTLATSGNLIIANGLDTETIVANMLKLQATNLTPQ